ncbi:MAG: hypothetical protein P4L35_18645 [Ignavibacteriaceae bacterium]|nr:hypothetical protein [Ignavibacteriaceae bacterium]
MKNNLLIILSCSIIFNSLLLSQGLRNSKWGDSPLKVKESESLYPSGDKGNELYYSNTNLEGIPCVLYYSFEKNKLVSGQYQGRFDDGAMEFIAYKIWYKELLARYGNPIESKYENFDNDEKYAFEIFRNNEGTTLWSLELWDNNKKLSNDNLELVNTKMFSFHFLFEEGQVRVVTKWNYKNDVITLRIEQGDNNTVLTVLTFMVKKYYNKLRGEQGK